MALPVVVINNNSGSNTQASGAGPGTAVYGTAGSVTNGSGSVSITDAVDLSGVATDGSAVLRIATSSGRKFSKITAISGSSGAWTVTVEDTVWTSGSGLSWAIGGKRLDFETTNSNTKQLFADAKPGWTIRVEGMGGAVTGATNASPIVITSASHGLSTGAWVNVRGVLGNTAANGTFLVTVVDANSFSLDSSSGSGAYTSGGRWSLAYVLTSATAFSASGDATSGPVAFTGSGTYKPVITSSTSGVDMFTVSGSGLTVSGIRFTHAGSTRGNALAISGSRTNWDVCDCAFDGVLRGISTTTSSNRVNGLAVVNCEFANCTAASAGALSNYEQTFVRGCYIHDNASCAGISIEQTNTGRGLSVSGSIIVNNAYGIRQNTNVSSTITVDRCTIAGNTSGGVSDGNRTSSFLTLGLASNIIYGNGGYGVSTAQAQAATEYYLLYNRNNAYGSNTSGNLSAVPAGTGDIALSGDPFANAAAGNYAPDNTAGEGAACRAAGFPGAFPGELTTSYSDVGAVQHQDAGGSTYYGPSLARIVNAGGV